MENSAPFRMIIAATTAGIYTHRHTDRRLNLLRSVLVLYKYLRLNALFVLRSCILPAIQGVSFQCDRATENCIMTAIALVVIKIDDVFLEIFILQIPDTYAEFGFLPIEERKRKQYLNKFFLSFC